MDVTALPEEPLLILESVYQRRDGTLYAIDDNSLGKYVGNLDGLALSASQEWQITKGSQQTTESVSVQVSVEVIAPALSAVLIEMDGGNAELRRQSLGEGTNVTVSPDASWALIEEYLSDGAVRRTAVNAQDDDAFATIYLRGENGVCMPVTYTLCFLSAQEKR